MKDIEQLVNQLSSEAKPIRPAPSPWMLSLKWSGAALAYLLVALAASGLRTDLALALQHPLYVAEMLLLLLILLSTTLGSALLAFPDLHQKRALAYTPIALFVLFILLLIFAWRADAPPAPFPVHSFECTLDITLISLLPAALAFFALRGYASTHPNWAGSFALLAAFSVGAIWLRLYEVNDSILHVVQWHYLPMVAVGLLGWFAGRRLLNW
ncbi:MAG: DUF1109 domain-containing protein [Gammaproteobacteria bacterium]|nr:DUF1109 domain-containing protein [Gammaproteobacteria bacterium]MBU1625340.1 DUF1109 domain-containing protein [Gammaproteobacteria bacterium]MBU1981600.1 DUF1109 domain-containing protein [Gammaproteobacteria bacterium]